MASTSSSSKLTEDKAKVASTRNPISLRLYKVLATSYDDPATREALQTLSELYHTPEDTRIPASTDKDGLSRLDDISDKLSPGNGIAARARKNLRRDAEVKLTQSTWQFLRAFKEVDSKLDELQQHTNAMRLRCDEAQTQLQTTNEACRSLLERAEGLRSARHAVGDKQFAVDSFIARFSLTEDEITTLQSRDIHIDPSFFNTMRKADRIIQDARVLMAGDEGPTKAGVEIISATSQQLEQGYDKIARWCSLELRQFVRDAQLEVSSLMREAIRWLRNRPELLTESLSVLAQTRQSTLLNSFMDALTRGGPNGLPRPIEIHAHDPLRYVGDMLAWVHQTIAGEREFLEALFDVKGDRRMVGSVRVFKESEEEEWIRDLMDKAFEKLRSPLRLRVRQTVRSQESSITTYKVANLLSFYNTTMTRTIGQKAGLSATLNEITDEAYGVFFDTLEAQARSLARTLLPDHQDIQPPAALLDHMQILREILVVYTNSLLGDESANEKRDGFRSILDLVVDAAVSMCTSVSDARKLQKAAWDRDVFMLNCLENLVSVLKPHEFTDYKTKSLQEDIDARANILAADHYQNTLHDAGLDDCLAICDDKSSNEPLSHIGAMEPRSLTAALHNFSLWLSSQDVVRSPRLAHLTDQKLAEGVHLTALRSLAAAYEKICVEVRKPENKYEAANTILGSERPFGSLNALGQILGLGEGEYS